MTPQEKADELFNKYLPYTTFSKSAAKACVKITALEAQSVVPKGGEAYDFWNKVIEEHTKIKHG